MKLNETVIAGLPPPSTGNKLYFFPGAIVQGATVPRGFAVRVTKDGARAFVLDYRAGHRQRRLTIGRWPDWSALTAVREAREHATASTAATILLPSARQRQSLCRNRS